MKNRGLKHRFDKDELQSAWAFHFTCFYCGKSHADCFHHIMSPSSQRFIDGDFNSSILNSCPVNNQFCHIHKGELHSEMIEKTFARKVINTLIESGYKMNEKDFVFYNKYPFLYS